MLEDVKQQRRFGTCLIARGSEVGGGDERTISAR
jgi:Lon protease-like protein